MPSRPNCGSWAFHWRGRDENMIIGWLDDHVMGAQMIMNRKADH
jgi:hypothetical protein